MTALDVKMYSVAGGKYTRTILHFSDRAQKKSISLNKTEGNYISSKGANTQPVNYGQFANKKAATESTVTA